jgi:hypothetical protein
MWVITFAATAAMFFVDTAKGQFGIANGTDKAWLVRYHKQNENKSGDIAVRLRIDPNADDKLTAKLTRFDSTKQGDTKFKKRDVGGEINLTGLITSNSGEGKVRKREEFVLVGTYSEESGVPHLVTVWGYFYTGKKKTEDATGRADDRVCIRVYDKDLTLGLSPAAEAPRFGSRPTEPCDEQPPDEDVLTEEESPADTDPDYDPQ